MVPPLPAAPWEQVPQGNSSTIDVLERSTKDSPITCQKVSQLPGEQMQTTQIWQTANKTCYHHPLGGIMCGPHRTIDPQGQGQDTNQLYVCHNDRPSNKLV